MIEKLKSHRIKNRCILLPNMEKYEYQDIESNTVEFDKRMPKEKLIWRGIEDECEI